MLFVTFTASGDIKDASSDEIPDTLNNILIPLEEESGTESKLAIQRKAKAKKFEYENLRLFNNRSSSKLILEAQFPPLRSKQNQRNSTMDETPQEFSFSHRDDESVLTSNDILCSRKSSKDLGNGANARTFIKKVKSNMVSLETSKAQPLNSSREQKTSNISEAISKLKSKKNNEKLLNKHESKDFDSDQGLDGLLSILSKPKVENKLQKKPKSKEESFETTNFQKSSTISLNSSMNENPSKTKIAKDFNSILDSFQPITDENMNTKKFKKNKESQPVVKNKNFNRIETLKNKYAKVFEKMESKENRNISNHHKSSFNNSQESIYEMKSYSKPLSLKNTNVVSERLKTTESVGWQYLEDQLNNSLNLKPRLSLNEKEDFIQIKEDVNYHNFSFISKAHYNIAQTSFDETVKNNKLDDSNYILEDFAISDHNNTVELQIVNEKSEEEEQRKNGVFDKIFNSLKELNEQSRESNLTGVFNKHHVNDILENIKESQEIKDLECHSDFNISDFELNIGEEINQAKPIKHKPTKQALTQKEAKLFKNNQSRNFKQFTSTISKILSKKKSIVKIPQRSSPELQFCYIIRLMARIIKLKELYSGWTALKKYTIFRNKTQFTPCKTEPILEDQYINSSPILFSCKVNSNPTLTQTNQNYDSKSFNRSSTCSNLILGKLFLIPEEKVFEEKENYQSYLIPLLLLDSSFKKVEKFSNLRSFFTTLKIYFAPFNLTIPNERDPIINHLPRAKDSQEQGILIKFSGQKICHDRPRSQSPLFSPPNIVKEPLFSLSTKKKRSQTVQYLSYNS